MKQFLRIAIVILILAGLGFATYSMFFKPANKDEVYLTLSTVHAEGENGNTTKYEMALNKVSKQNFDLGGNYGTVLSEYREKYIQDTTGAGKHLYPKYKESLDTIFNYYYAYSQAVCKTVPKAALNAVKNAVKEYNNALNRLDAEGFAPVDKLQTYLKEHPNETGNDSSGELALRYQRLVQLFRQYISKYIDLVVETENFVVEYVFDGEMITDRESLLYSLAVKSLKKAVTGDYVFDNSDAQVVLDDYMNSAMNFLDLAMKSDSDKENAINKINYYDGNVVLYNKIVYAPDAEGNYLITIGNTENSYVLNENKEVVLASDGVTLLEGATYYQNNFYRKSSDGILGGEPLKYKKMIQAYNRVMKDAQDELNKIIELSYEKKVDFVNGGESVRSTFNNLYQEDLEYILVCCGFHSLEV